MVVCTTNPLVYTTFLSLFQKRNIIIFVTCIVRGPLNPLGLRHLVSLSLSFLSGSLNVDRQSGVLRCESTCLDHSWSDDDVKSAVACVHACQIVRESSGLVSSLQLTVRLLTWTSITATWKTYHICPASLRWLT